MQDYQNAEEYFLNNDYEAMPHDISEPKLSKEAKENLTSYNFGRFERFKNLDPSLFYDDLPSRFILNDHNRMRKFLDRRLNSATITYSDIINIIGEEEMNKSISEYIKKIISIVNSIEYHYKILLDYIAEPSMEKWDKFKEIKIYVGHQGYFHGDIFNYTGGKDTEFIEDRKKNIREQKCCLENGYMSEEMIDDLTEYNRTMRYGKDFGGGLKKDSPKLLRKILDNYYTYFESKEKK